LLNINDYRKKRLIKKEGVRGIIEAQKQAPPGDQASAKSSAMADTAERFLQFKIGARKKCRKKNESGKGRESESVSWIHLRKTTGVSCEANY